jgi:anti-sigma factor RsiW
VSTTPDPKTCARIRAMLHELAEGRGSDDVRNEAGAHVSACPSCSDVRKLARKLTCQEIASFLDDVVEGRLTNAQRTVFDTHLALCPPCIVYVAGYKRCVALARGCQEAESRTDDEGPPPEMPSALIQAILAARQAKDE